MKKEFEFRYDETVKVLSTTPSGWSKEFNWVDVEGSKMLDIRKWSPDHKKCGKGISLNANEAMALCDALVEMFHITLPPQAEPTEPDPEPQPPQTEPADPEPRSPQADPEPLSKTNWVLFCNTPCPVPVDEPVEPDPEPVVIAEPSEPDPEPVAVQPFTPPELEVNFDPDVIANIMAARAIMNKMG